MPDFVAGVTCNKRWCFCVFHASIKSLKFAAPEFLAVFRETEPGARQTALVVSRRFPPVREQLLPWLDGWDFHPRAQRPSRAAAAHLDTGTQRKQLPLPAKRGEGFVLVNIGLLPLNFLGALASRRPVGSGKPELAGETPALPGTVPRFGADVMCCARTISPAVA
jgi:hypothetical protein